MVFCCAVACNSNSKVKKQEEECRATSFYRLPRNPSLKKLWITNMKRENLPEDARLCHKHFDEECFERDLQVCYLHSTLLSLIYKKKVIKICYAVVIILLYKKKATYRLCLFRREFQITFQSKLNKF